MNNPSASIGNCRQLERRTESLALCILLLVAWILSNSTFDPREPDTLADRSSNVGLDESSRKKSASASGSSAVDATGPFVRYASFASPDDSATPRSEANDLKGTLAPLFQASCVQCHAQDGEAGLDLENLSNDHSDPKGFALWVRIHDRIQSGEMPPPSEPRPDPALIANSLAALNSDLMRINDERHRTNGRTVLRRLTRTEFEYAVNDLLGIEAELANFIPAENASGFDVIAQAQGISPQHIRGFAAAAERAIDFAIRFDPPPEDQTLRRSNYRKHPGIREHIDKVNEGTVIFGETDDAVVLFASAPWLTKVPDFHAPNQGRYRIRASVHAHQTDQPVVFSFHVGDYKRGASELIEAFDVVGSEPQVVEVEAIVESGQYLFVDALHLQTAPDGKGIWNVGAKEYAGAGVALQWVEVEGPIVEQWPPRCTEKLLGQTAIRKLDHKKWDPKRNRETQYQMVATEDPEAQLLDIVARLAPRAFRRPVAMREQLALVQVGVQVLEHGGDFDRAVRAVCQSILTSPEFLFESASPGRLDDFALASRLALFLWRSIPDETLFILAKDNALSQSSTLRMQVDRMLDDPKAQRLVVDFARQWLNLREIDANAPDMKLYPEFDELLQRAMLAETHQFLSHLIQEDLSSDLLIDSNFTFANRRLAEHYGIDGIAGQGMRKIELPPDSLRGGILTQASIMKVTANGTTTSPVRRGAFVLTSLLGTPPSAPPPAVGSIEPDTRGATTIRELLDKHRNSDSCAQCHRLIDPPGFALESFDVIGGFRDRYRSQEKGDAVTEKLHGRNIWEYKWGPPVDCSGTMQTGEVFADVKGFKTLLMKQREQIAKNLVSQWIAFGTGADVEFADREELVAIMDRCRDRKFGLRTMIHEVIQSDLFRNK